MDDDPMAYIVLENCFLCESHVTGTPDHSLLFSGSPLVSDVARRVYAAHRCFK